MRVISKGPARHPRWLDERSVLVLHPEVDGNVAKGARLERVAIEGGSRTKLATLPEFVCNDRDPDAGDSSEQWSLDVRAEDDVVLDASMRFACVTVMDRNLNMANMMLTARIDLQTGELARWLQISHAEFTDLSCAPRKDITVGEPGAADVCSPREHVPSRAPVAPLRFVFENEQLLEQQGARRVARWRLAGYSVDERSPSPSHRWVVLGGDVEAEDYVHRSLVLLDLARGDLFPIRKKAGGAWPPALKATGRKTPRIATPVKDTVGVVGESDVRWLGSPDSEILIVDGIVIRPGVGSFAVHGEVAR